MQTSILEYECNLCHEVKPMADFMKSSRSKTGYVRSCKSCMNAYNRKRYSRPEVKEHYKNYRSENKEKISKYRRARYEREKEHHVDIILKNRFGVSLDWYNQTLEEQGGVCAICGNGQTHRRLSVDHCHQTGAVRGLLCDLCNTGLGSFRDNKDSLRMAINYLSKSTT